MSTSKPSEKPQIDKFKDLARELETNEDEAAFDRALKKVAKAKTEVVEKNPKHDSSNRD